MKYKILFEKSADNQLKKLDTTQQRIIVSWIVKNLTNAHDPRIFGKPLKGDLRDYWRHRMGNYRIIAEIDDDELRILIIGIGHPLVIRAY